MNNRTQNKKRPKSKDVLPTGGIKDQECDLGVFRINSDDFVVTAFRRKENGVILPKRGNHYYNWFPDGETPLEENGTFEARIRNELYEIYSVSNSEGTEFKIGDTVCYRNYDGQWITANKDVITGFRPTRGYEYSNKMTILTSRNLGISGQPGAGGFCTVSNNVRHEANC